MRILLCLFLLSGLFVLNFCIENEEMTEENEEFIPTREWQVVKKGQKIPKGLHVRINFETGITEAKILDEDENTPKTQALGEVPTEDDDAADLPDISNVNINLKKSIEEALSKLKADDPTDAEYDNHINKKYRTYEQLKQDFSDLNLVAKTDAEILIELIEKHKELYHESEVPDEEELYTLLQDVEYLVHQFDNAVEFIKLDGYKSVIYKNLNHTSANIRQEALKIFGSALQNNVKLQIHVLETGGLDTLLRILSLDTDILVKNRAIFALSGFLRKFPLAQLKFIENAGMSVINRLFEVKDLKLRMKLVNLISDLLSDPIEAQKDISNPEFKEKVRQYNTVDFRTHLFKLNMCTFLEELLLNIVSIDGRDYDAIEKCLKLVQLTTDECGHSENLLRILIGLHPEFKILAEEETGNDILYYTHLLDITSSIISTLKLKHKSEL